jgi:hypothetical protein
MALLQKMTVPVTPIPGRLLLQRFLCYSMLHQRGSLARCNDKTWIRDFCIYDFEKIICLFEGFWWSMHERVDEHIKL